MILSSLKEHSVPIETVWVPGLRKNILLVAWCINCILDKATLNCASFAGGVIEAVLCAGGFPAKVTTHWHKGTTFMIQFHESVIEREKNNN